MRLAGHKISAPKRRCVVLRVRLLLDCHNFHILTFCLVDDLCVGPMVPIIFI